MLFTISERYKLTMRMNFTEPTRVDLPRPVEVSGDRPCWNKLERVGWTAGQAFISYGHRFGIRVSDPAVWPEVAAHLPPGSVATESPLVDSLYSLKVAAPSEGGARVRGRHLLYHGTALVARTGDLAEALMALESHLHGQIASAASEFLFVHAGVVGWQGQAILVPGRSFSGKTSLTAALLAAGAEYFSDEYAVLDSLGLVYPYPKTLSLRDADGQPQESRTAESLGSRTASTPLPAGLILDTKYVAGGRWRPRPVSAGAALFTLLDNTVQVRSRPQWALKILQSAVAEAATVKSTRGEADIVAAWALKRLCAELE